MSVPQATKSIWSPAADPPADWHFSESDLPMVRAMMKAEEAARLKCAARDKVYIVAFRAAAAWAIVYFVFLPYPFTSLFVLAWCLFFAARSERALKRTLILAVAARRLGTITMLGLPITIARTRDSEGKGEDLMNTPAACRLGEADAATGARAELTRATET